MNSSPSSSSSSPTPCSTFSCPCEHHGGISSYHNGQKFHVSECNSFEQREVVVAAVFTEGEVHDFEEMMALTRDVVEGEIAIVEAITRVEDSL